MKNPRFAAGELETHFIERETTLLDDMKAILEQERPWAINSPWFRATKRG